MTPVGRAPGRLDVLGGVGDYSGSLVLQAAIRAQTTVEIEPCSEYRLWSDSYGEAQAGSLDLGALPRWTHYPLGCLQVFMEAKGWRPDCGLSFRIRSDVPASVGVSSSAALEIATLRALSMISGIGFEGLEIAHLGRRAENEVVGVPCGLMDQLASAFGRVDTILTILCRPDALGEPIDLPDGIAVVGWPSQIARDVAGAPYAIARAAAFMGKRMIETRMGRAFRYTAELPMDDDLPERLPGARFLAEHGAIDDPLSTVEPDRSYPVRAATRFPIAEHARCCLAGDLLRAGRFEEVGALMYASHEGYSAMGLGTSETDRMVGWIERMGPAEGFYGARISGGGAGGTVVVLLDERAVGRLPGPLVR